MSDDKSAERLLQGAYALDTAKDNVDYYREFAPIYDTQYVDAMGYIYPARLAAVFKSVQQLTDTPVADIGCGTGLVAAMLDSQAIEIDGIDISSEMLDVARSKSLYRDLYQVDLKAGVSELPTDYGAVLSAGTFTFGHLGAEVLPELLQIGRRNAVYCIGVNAQHFDKEGFAQILDDLHVAGEISKPVLRHEKIYLDNSDSSHADDMATVVVYRKLKD